MPLESAPPPAPEPKAEPKAEQPPMKDRSERWEAGLEFFFSASVGFLGFALDFGLVFFFSFALFLRNSQTMG